MLDDKIFPPASVVDFATRNISEYAAATSGTLEK